MLKELVMKPNLVYGYPTVYLTVDGRKVIGQIHTLVAKAFLGPKPSARHEVNHEDGHKTNNYAGNLEYLTHLQNIRHSQRLGLVAFGERHPLSKLTTVKVRVIRRRYRLGDSQYSLARRYGVCRATIWQIVHRRYWKRA